MARRPRIAVVVLLVLAQLGGMRTVFCEEESGRRVLELLAPCCGGAAADARDAPGLAPESCGPCRDLPAVAALQKEDDDASRAQRAPALDVARPQLVVAPVPRDARARVPGAFARARERAPALVGTIVLTC